MMRVIGGQVMGAIQMVVDEQADLMLNYVADKIKIKII